MKTPKHIAIIMDGNRRWAKKKGLDVIIGHQKMAREGIERVVKAAIDFDISYLTLWAFSTENWNRNPREVKALMSLFRELFDVQVKELNELGVKIQTIGDISRFDQDIQENMTLWQEKTKNNNKLTVNFALNYGGRDEILRAVEKISKKVKTGELSTDKLSAEDFSKYLDTADMPEPDLIIRPGGDQRLSGFLLWQCNYSELYFTDTLMPDFGKKDLEKAILELNDRQRRFGK
ncbi:MAG: di-trans,poly-cis-decaprenylcistransferase [Candidatus Pacebacteria bacterium]|jgi:undecaprenyl diphosphate synthase|nr:di-trans,poly-cis-decaprenylcistransferase [Candidatus Paceibacterota bacterium]MBT4652605.1 di-trans,poly-cis-decaprenylcistransferase [Candidatus Paceibacterota bacterium]MBT6756432.1 di-trans,poly-cis-decaprenylcistransferase [Candidatus Paceibacterota bacterium]MBT6921274.1 di-trans,poly-cis-decaprenylcistransferase [Candidatus Paceibacterota bacterium]